MTNIATMKKIFIFSVAALMAVGCEQSKYGQGGRNACQFVKEQVPGLREDIASVEVIGVDTLLSDAMLSFGQVEFAKAGADFTSEQISQEEYEHIIDSTENVIKDVSWSWQYDHVNDSLRRLEKYDGCWRVAYQLKVTMKSGTIKNPRVLMDNDGTTPRMLEMDFAKILEEYQKKVTIARSRILEYLLWSDR